MTRAEIIKQLREFIRNFQIDPHDAGLVLEQVPSEGIDAETFGDHLDGAGYPELALVAYGTGGDGQPSAEYLAECKAENERAAAFREAI